MPNKAPTWEETVEAVPQWEETSEVVSDNGTPRGAKPFIQAEQDVVPSLTQMAVAAAPVIEYLANVPTLLANTPAILANAGMQAVGKKPYFRMLEHGEPIVPEILPEQNEMAQLLSMGLPGGEKRFGQALATGAMPVPTGIQATAGAAKGIEDLARGLSTPDVTMTLPAGGAPGLLQRAIPTVFGLQMISQQPEAYAQLGQASVEGSPADVARTGVNALGGTAMIGHMAAPGIFVTPRETVTSPSLGLEQAAPGAIPPRKIGTALTESPIQLMYRRLSIAQRQIVDEMLPWELELLNENAAKVNSRNFDLFVKSLRPDVKDKPQVTLPVINPPQHLQAQPGQGVNNSIGDVRRLEMLKKLGSFEDIPNSLVTPEEVIALLEPANYRLVDGVWRYQKVGVNVNLPTPKFEETLPVSEQVRPQRTEKDIVDFQHDLRGVAQFIKAGKDAGKFDEATVASFQNEGDALFSRFMAGEDVTADVQGLRQRVNALRKGEKPVTEAGETAEDLQRQAEAELNPVEAPQRETGKQFGTKRFYTNEEYGNEIDFGGPFAFDMASGRPKSMENVRTAFVINDRLYEGDKDTLIHPLLADKLLNDPSVPVEDKNVLSGYKTAEDPTQVQGMQKGFTVDREQPWQRYEHLAAELKGFRTVADLQSPRRMEVQREMEALKNQHGGMPPKRPEKLEPLEGVVKDEMTPAPGDIFIARKLGLFEGMTAHDAVSRLDRLTTELDADSLAVARFLKENYGEALKQSKVEFGVGQSERGVANYDPVTGVTHLGLRGSSERNIPLTERILHEGAHAATVWSYLHPQTEGQRLAVKEIERLMDVTKNGLDRENFEALKRGEFKNLAYYYKNPMEYIAGFFNDAEFRRHLEGVKTDKGTGLRRIVNTVLDMLGLRDANMRQVMEKQLMKLAEGSDKAIVEGRKAEGLQPLEAPPAPGMTKFDTLHDLPDLLDKAEANRLFSEKFGAEKIPVLGRILGGKARIESETDKAIAAWYVERHGVAKAVASALGAEMRGKVNKVFKANEQGDLNVERTRPGQSLKISDVFEELQADSTAYRLTPEQELIWNNNIKATLDRMSEMTKKYDLVGVTDEHGNFNPYFPRIVTELGREGRAGGSGARVGAKQFFQKERIFRTEQEGWQKGVKYLTDVEARLVRGTERLYTAIADRRLASDPVLGGKTRGALVRELKLAYAPELAAGTMSLERIRGIANSLQGQGTVMSPAFFGKIFEPEVARALNKEFAAEASSVRRVLSSANSAMKAVQLGFDFGVGQLQLLPTLYAAPHRWAKANAMGLAAMVRPETFTNYVKANLPYVRELSQLGSSTGSLQEYLMGLGQSEPLPRALEKIPLVGRAAAQVPLAFGRQFQTALDVAKIEMWKAWRDLTPKEEWPRLVQSIESVLFSGRMESGMVPHGRALLERVALLAPSYYRGSLNFVAALGEKGVTGKVARRSMGAFIIGSLAAYYATGLAVGMSKEELEKRMNPARADFMMWDVEMDGKRVNVGFGGIFRSYLRLFGKVAKTTREHPGNFSSLSSEKNPFMAWLRGHSAPIPSKGWDLITGKDFLGSESNLKDLPSSAAPLAVPNIVKGEYGQAAAGAVGLSSFPKPRPTFDELAEKRYGDRPLSLKERYETAKERNAYPPSTMDEQNRAATRALQYQQERRAALLDALPGPQKSFLEANRLSIGGYQTHVEIHGKSIPVMSDEKEKLAVYMREEYAAAIEKLMKSPNLAAYKEKGITQKRLDLLLELARKRAMARWKRDLPRTAP